MTRLTGTPTVAEIEAAAGRLRPHVVRTPMRRSTWLSDRLGTEVWLKLESLQATGSFKYRGAQNAVLAFREREPGATLVMTASAGNHGVALAVAAARAGLKTRVHLPATAPAAKREAIAAAGAHLVIAPTYDAAEDAAREDCARSGVPFISPYDDRDVIAGAGTVALEMLEDRPDLDLIVVPVGGGGLISGIALVAASRTPPVRVTGVEAAASPAFTAALAAGRPVVVPVGPTLADGLAGNMDPDSRTFAVVRDHVAGVVMVAEDAIAEAMRGLVTHEGLVAEGAGATTVAGLLTGAVAVAGSRLGVVVSGRNK